MAELLKEGFVAAELMRRAQGVLAAQRGSVPVLTSALKNSLQAKPVENPSRVTVRVGSFSLKYGILVEARTGFISRSVSGGGGA